ncbi:hypothetical protein PG997_008920 [Apiospora hydei]|uniref:Terpene cyclase/mutase family member n=1 Tax=Apiospora hydei TaxID=1337664 RepID=A0ABR1WCE7_9PEZI
MTNVKIAASTDLTRWRLRTDLGDSHWTYLSEADSKESPQSDAEKYLLGLPISQEKTTKINGSTNQGDSVVFNDAARKGFSFLTRVQLPEGHWACDYGGPSFLLPGLIFAMYITGTPIPDEWKIEMTRYLAHHANEDGGWGLHLEGKSTVFATGLYYVMLRILGHDKDHHLLVKARGCLLSHGGAAGIQQWGKIWLACLNLYSWDGVNCIPTDLWVLPELLPFHPWRWWVQCRVVYLPTSYLWSNQCTVPLNPLLKEIREEIYTEPYRSVDFRRARNYTAPSDSLRKISPFLLVCFALIRIWFDFFRPRWFHRLADRRVSQLMRNEEHNTNYNCLAPVNKAFQMVAAYFEDGPDSERVRRHREKVEVYMCLGPQGMTCGGTNGVQVWDTAFIVQTAAGAGLAADPRFRAPLIRALDFLDKSQLRDNLDDPHRHPRKGAGRSAPRATATSGYPSLIDDSRLFDCIDTLLGMQNADRGYASYELIRGGKYLHHLNPAEVFDKIMVECTYPECTTAVLTALARFQRHFPAYRSQDIQRTIKKAVGFIRSRQRPDGSWYGAWAICFTYATFFAVQSLEAAGEQYCNSASVRKACEFLLSKQRDDGGWGEHHSSCDERRYIQHDVTSQVVNTAWAVMALMHAGYPDPVPIQRGLEVSTRWISKTGS